MRDVRWILGLLVVTVLVVWFVPGVDRFVEDVVQQVLGRAAR